MLVRVYWLDGIDYTVTLDDEMKNKLMLMGNKMKCYFLTGVLRTAIIEGIDVLCKQCKLTDNGKGLSDGTRKETCSKESI